MLRVGDSLARLGIPLRQCLAQGYTIFFSRKRIPIFENAKERDAFFPIIIIFFDRV